MEDTLSCSLVFGDASLHAGSVLHVPHKRAMLHYTHKPPFPGDASPGGEGVEVGVGWDRYVYKSFIFMWKELGKSPSVN